jgi:glycosyltransferase involved in cell wall biosynthesis
VKYVKLKPIIFISIRFSSLSGGYQRLYEILLRAKSIGLDYVILTDYQSCINATKIFPDFVDVLKKYRTYLYTSNRQNQSQISFIRYISAFKENLKSAILLSRIAKREKVDLILGPGEGMTEVETAYLASFLCSKPWAIILQPTTDLLQPTYSIGPLTPWNILAHVSGKRSMQKASKLSKLGSSLGILFFLKMLEGGLVLPVSKSVVEDFKIMNPRLKLTLIDPGCGVNIKEFPIEEICSFKYDGVFFARIVKQKGVFDLVDIWDQVVSVFPRAVLAICGISENPEIVKELLSQIERKGLSTNIKFLGQQDRETLFSIVQHSCLTIYPTYADSFSLVMIESLACGTPILAYSLSTVRHVFNKCQAVIPHPVGDKKSIANSAIKLLKDRDQRKLLSDEARRFVSVLDWANVVQAEKLAYFEALRSTKRASS